MSIISIRAIDKTLSGATRLDQSGPGSNCCILIKCEYASMINNNTSMINKNTNTYTNTGGLCRFNFCLLSFAIWGEKQNFKKPMLTILYWSHPHRFTWWILWCVRSVQVEIRKTRPPRSTVEHNYCLFEILKFS